MQTQIELRHTITDAEVRQLCELFQREWWTKGRTIESVHAVLRGSTHLFAYFDQNKDLVAFARVLSDGVFKALLFDVICREDQRNTGLGQRILNDVTSHPDISKVQHLELYCKDELIPFYERFGFSIDIGGINLMRRIAAPASESN